MSLSLTSPSPVVHPVPPLVPLKPTTSPFMATPTISLDDLLVSGGSQTLFRGAQTWHMAYFPIDCHRSPPRVDALLALWGHFSGHSDPTELPKVSHGFPVYCPPDPRTNPYVHPKLSPLMTSDSMFFPMRTRSRAQPQEPQPCPGEATLGRLQTQHGSVSKFGTDFRAFFSSGDLKM